MLKYREHVEGIFIDLMQLCVETDATSRIDDG